ncbi:hypothetical protein SKAU_G00163050 [Synaphobranchus kaupii]|uniref:Uncharacterized protein n=1 Tax=Synaphobranchus kaupii TaxID=118154 RepID=A0A9Q1FJG6_SYNKA|nr:hypothetical protein SKAU_G00163050 [Synaphobranchus kaupii]
MAMLLSTWTLDCTYDPLYVDMAVVQLCPVVSGLSCAADDGTPGSYVPAPSDRAALHKSGSRGHELDEGTAQLNGRTGGSLTRDDTLPSRQRRGRLCVPRPRGAAGQPHWHGKEPERKIEDGVGWGAPSHSQDVDVLFPPGRAGCSPSRFPRIIFSLTAGWKGGALAGWAGRAVPGEKVPDHRTGSSDSLQPVVTGGELNASALPFPARCTRPARLGWASPSPRFASR